MKKYKFLLLLSIVLLISSCALKPIISEYTFIKTDLENVDLDKLGNGTILIYNGADILHKMDNTARLNIWINKKALGQIRGREYVIVNLKKGEYEFKALHIDVVNMRSTHTVEIDENTKVIKIKPNLTSNKLTITNELPRKFEKYKYAEKK
ncbi:hypothetical protein [Polaribacter sp. SA4-12]|uniref:hypothetical protein n=1 Tax=Polaribacter sp. SA4-12 TaxID=1312072 RepID=UPI000B3CF48C|nr:hypothetical protein [Polaribacter sp. SA4-12]ARV16937.1 hypothetical protein BTO07_14610 [Polaribacter sp. SA4-12]